MEDEECDDEIHASLAEPKKEIIASKPRTNTKGGRKNRKDLTRQFSQSGSFVDTTVDLSFIPKTKRAAKMLTKAGLRNDGPVSPLKRRKPPSPVSQEVFPTLGTMDPKPLKRRNTLKRTSSWAMPLKKS
eukprot:TRINITY_DN398_c0_g1_i9.p1 TRINITY_DN398_c0_g1~~TRINITY_DN398_c0_g1_i9.p1  ORF type:complete len:129 (+),score=43.58 TRINITY_DN398_c0_g1_i9:178-564(+)